MNNGKLNKKISDIKLEIENLVSEINVQKNDSFAALNFDDIKEEDIEKENLEINSNLDFLDQENERLFLRIETLKNEVHDAIKKLASENTFMDVIEKFINIYGVQNIDKNELNKFFNINNKYVDESNVLSNTQLEKIKEADTTTKAPISDFVTSMQKIFEEELKKLEKINNDKDTFILENVSQNSLTDEQKLFEIFSKIDELKNDYLNRLNSLFSSKNINDIEIESLKKVYENLKSTISESYSELKKDFTKSISWQTFLNDLPQKKTLIEKSKNFVEDSYENIDQKINEILSKIENEKNKHDSSDYGLNSFNSYLLFNKVDDSALENSLSKIYSECIENFVENLKFKKEEINDTNYSFQELINSVSEGIVLKIKKINDSNNNTRNLDDELSNNNFFTQKVLELLTNIKSSFKEALSVELESINSLISSLSMESLKQDKENFSFLIEMIKTKKFDFVNLVNGISKKVQEELEKIVNLNTYNLETVKQDIIFDINDCLKQLHVIEEEYDEILGYVEKLEKQFKIHKFDKLKKVYETMISYQNSESRNFSFENRQDEIVNVRLERLEKQFNKFVNILDPLNKKIMESSTNEEYDNRLKELENKISSKIDQLILSIAHERETIKKQNNDAIEQILESNKNQKESILNLIQEIEEEKMSMISDQSVKNMMENNVKLTELEKLIQLQSSEIESLLNEKNEFIQEIENVLATKKDRLTDDKLTELQLSINDVINNFNVKIQDLEYNLDRRMSMIDLSSLDLTINENQKDFFNTIESTLTNNYELVKHELKTDLVDILNNVNQLKSNYENVKFDTNAYDEKFDEITSRFEQFSFILKSISEKLTDQSNNNNKESEVDNLVNILNEKFDGLVKSLREENIKSNALLSRKVHKTSKSLTSKIISNINEINSKFASFIDEAKKEKISFEGTKENIVNSIIQSNNQNKKEILDRIGELEKENFDVLNEMEIRQVAIENNKLRELEDLINLQNQELESLLIEKNEFVSEIEKIIKNKHSELSNENIAELKTSINDLILRMDSRIQLLENNLDEKITSLNVKDIETSSQINESQQQFFDALENKLVNNYEIIKNEFKMDLVDILNNISDLKQGYLELKDSRNSYSGIEEIKDQFEHFSFLLKNVSERLLEQDSSKTDEIDVLINNLNSQFANLITNIKEENYKTSKKIVKKVTKANQQLSKQFNDNLIEMNKTFNSFLNNIKKENEMMLSSSIESIKNIIEVNKINKQEIFDIIASIEQKNMNVINQYEIERNQMENNRLNELEKLIDVQNSEILGLIEEKNSIIEEIEKIIIENRESLIRSEKNEEMQESLENIMLKFDNRIIALEQNLYKKIDDISKTVPDSTNNEIQRIENNLIQNYGFLKEDIRNIFLDLSNKFQDLSSSYNNNPNEDMNELINSLFMEIKDLKNMSESLIFEIKENSNSILRIENVLEKQLSNFIEEQKTTFKNIESIMSGESNPIIAEKAEELEKWYSTMNELISSHSDFVEYLNNKVDDIEAAVKKIDKTNVAELETIFNEMNSKIDRNEIAINTLHESASISFKELKNSILDKLENPNINNTISQIETQQLLSLTSKLNELEDLLLLQDEQIASLINEKDELIKELEANKDQIENEREKIEEIATNAFSLNEKLDSLYNNVSSNINDIVNINNNSNVDNAEDLNKKIDELISSTNENISISKSDIAVASDNTFNSKERLSNLTLKLEEIKKEINEIETIQAESKNYKMLNEKLDSIRNALLNCDLDLLALKEAAYNKIIESNDNKTNLEMNSLNKEKINLVDDLIKHNKQYLNNILNQKTELVNLLNDDNKNEFNNLIESKASYYVDLLAQKLLEKQSEEYKIINDKINELKEKFNLVINPQDLKQNYDIANQINKLEQEISLIFDIVENKKREIINLLSKNINTNSDEIKNIIQKFESNKNEIIREYEQELESFKKEILGLKDDELYQFKTEVSIIEDEINELKESNYDSSNQSHVNKDFEPLENLVEELNFEINSFEQEKENLYKELKEKMDFLNSLDQPSEDAILESINTSKFKQSLSSEAKIIIENEFNSFEKEFRKNLELVKKGLTNIKQVYQNDIDNPTWFKTFNDKLENIEKTLLDEKEQKDKNLQEKKNNHLKYDIDDLEINDKNYISFINNQESRKKEIENFYKKIRDLENYWKNK